MPNCQLFLPLKRENKLKKCNQEGICSHKRRKFPPNGVIVKNKLADLILFHRKQSGLSQQELAELAGVGKNMVYELEGGKQSVRLENLLKVLQVLNIELDFQSPLREAFLKEYSDAER